MSATTYELPGFSGELLYPGEAGHDEARAVFNAMFDRRPALIARCANTHDVVATVNLARSTGLPMSVYGGGHNVMGSAVVDAGIVCDLRGMKGIEVDADGRTVRAEGGLTWGEFDAATTAHGLAVTGGRVPGTGIGGLALGSGSGWLERKFGFTCDNLLAAEVVTADGRQVTASAEENADLFWALRGGGGNFGVVTAFHLRLHPVPDLMLGGMLMYPAPMAADVVKHWRDFMAEAPDEVGSACAFISAPPIDAVPEPVRGQPVLGVVVLYVGSVADGQEALRPLLEFGPPAVSMVEPMPYVAIQQLIAAASPSGLLNYWTADFLADLPDDAVDALASRATHPVSPLGQVLLLPGGGAVARVPADATAIGQRNAPWNTHILSMWPDPADTDRNIAFTRELGATLEPWKTGRTYLNYIGDEGPTRVEAAFGPERYARLQRTKSEWDPENFFSHNQNIKPA